MSAPRGFGASGVAWNWSTFPGGRLGSGFTLLFEAFLLALCKAMPVAAVARVVGEHDTRIWRVLHHYVDQVRAEADFSGVWRVGVDETSSKRGHNYGSLFVDLEEVYRTDRRMSRGR
jgi:transposase